MKEILIATYIRESTLWKNANAFYKAQDWTKMECLFADYSDYRNDNMFTLTNRETGEVIDKGAVWFDRFIIRFTNKSGRCNKEYEFKTKEEANEFFKEVMKDKILGNFRKVI